MRIVLIRHFKTPGNQLGRYIGRTDESLAQPIEGVASKGYPKVERIYASPLKRCLQTAGRIYPNQTVIVEPELRECDFGLFENKNYQELAGDEAYQKWVDSYGKAQFPQGEDPMEFRKRCIHAFDQCIQDSIKDAVESVAFVVHGGTIMSIMEAYEKKQKDFYEYQVSNGSGFELELDCKRWQDGIRRMMCIDPVD